MDFMSIVSSLHVFSMRMIIMLLSPSVLGLLSMLDICVSFRLSCNVTFNAKESICIAVIRKKLKSKLISLMMINMKRPAWTTSPAREEGRPRNPLLPVPGAAQARALSRQLV